MSNQTHTTFIQIKIHTAKCDTCNKHNTLTMFRCVDCGQQCCTPCWLRKGGDGTHVLNAGDKGWTGERAQMVSMPRKERAQQRKPSENRVVKRQATRHRNRYVIADEEDEEQEEEEERNDVVDEDVVVARTRTATRTEKKPEVADGREALTVPKPSEDHADRPTVQHTTTQAETFIRAAADALLLNAIDPSSGDDEGFSMLLRAAAEINEPRPRPRALPEPKSRRAESETNNEQDAQPQTPLFVPDNGGDLQVPHEVSRVGRKGNGQQIQEENPHQEKGIEKDERSVMWE